MANKKSLKPVILLPAPSVSNVIVDIGDAMYDFGAFYGRARCNFVGNRGL